MNQMTPEEEARLNAEMTNLTEPWNAALVRFRQMTEDGYVIPSIHMIVALLIQNAPSVDFFDHTAHFRNDSLNSCMHFASELDSLCAIMFMIGQEAALRGVDVSTQPGAVIS